MTIVRWAEERDLDEILNIYNQGITDRIATLETETKDIHYMSEWFHSHSGRYRVFVAERNAAVIDVEIVPIIRLLSLNVQRCLLVHMHNE